MPDAWTPARRKHQASIIHRWKPWRKSTGPRTEAGKAIVSQNAFKHGARSATAIQEARKFRAAILELSEC